MTPGHCSACQGPAERGTSGAWWHLGESCWARTPFAAHPADYAPARFVPEPTSGSYQPPTEGQR